MGVTGKQGRCTRSHKADSELLEAGERHGGPLHVADNVDIANFVPPPGLAPFVTQIYFFRCEERQTRDRQPAALGHLMFFLRGSAVVQFQTGEKIAVWGPMHNGPGLAFAEFVLNGPVHVLGFALSPLGFVALTGKPANLFADRTVPAAELFGPEIDRWRQGLAPDMTMARCALPIWCSRRPPFCSGKFAPYRPRT